MNDTKKLAAFLRTAIREGVTAGAFTEAAKQFYANVDVLSTCTAEQWFATNKEQADMVDRVYEAYNAPDEPVAESEQPVTEAADNTVSELEKLQARVQALEDAKAQPVETPAPSEAAPEATPAEGA